MNKIKLLPMVPIILALVTACDFFKVKTEEESTAKSPAVASVDDMFLRKSDLDFVTKETNNPSDSTNLAKRYVQSWVKKQLMIKEASQKVAVSKAELDKKLLDYKYALIVYEYEKSYIEKHLDKNVSNEEIKSYYEGNKENFTLKEIIVRANFIKMNKNLSQNKDADQLLNQSNESAKHELRELAIKSAANYFLEDSTWVKFDELISNTPLADNQNKVQLLTRDNPLIKAEDDQFNYYYKILEYKLQDQVPPVEFVKDEISKIIINKRKVNLAESLQNEVYSRAQGNNEFKIYE
ncbi:peptidyl-prolyl cis-trans isomerase [Echinicola strongylocentroti]|uniref:peptidyl-prolyl cis-trans isomerase n=1 Tax=Echinicola strongylocentroti TaxID=1795355 RepID=UPI001FED14E7|nr:peptidyl-prolyl cis-trans isomerase [Echinicola strongylocentroti]